MADVRIVGDHMFEAHGSSLAPLQAPAARVEATSSPADDRRRLETADGHVVYPLDYRRTLPAYENAARDVHKLPVVRVWEIVHAGGLRGACYHESVTPPRYVILLNGFQCAVHRIATFEHELEHVRRGFPAKVQECDAALREALEALSDEAGDAGAESAARLAARRLSEAGSSVSVDPQRCRTCSHNSEAACAQGAETYGAVQRALAEL